MRPRATPDRAGWRRDGRKKRDPRRGARIRGKPQTAPQRGGREPVFFERRRGGRTGLLYAARNVDDTQCPRARGPGPVRPVHALRRAMSRGTARMGLGARGWVHGGRARAVPRVKEGSFLEAGYLGRRDDLGRVDCVCGPTATGVIIVGGRARYRKQRCVVSRRVARLSLGTLTSLTAQRP